MTESTWHPAAQPEPLLLAECELERLRRSGPGGQRRNKVETGVRLKHRPTGLVSEATERRSAQQNHAAAVLRLRYLLALHVRGPTSSLPSELWRRRARGGRLAVNPDHDDAPALLAEALDVLTALDWDHRAAARQLAVSATQLVRLLSLEPEALRRLNAARSVRGLSPLKTC